MSSYVLRRAFVFQALCLVWLVAAQSTVSAEPEAAAPADVKVPAFAPATVIAGSSAHERGVAYGKQFKDGIHQFLQQEIYDALAGKASSKDEMLAYAAACGKVTREVCPLVAEEIAGMAEGAGMTYEEMILIHAHEEMYHRSKLPTEKEGHCTAVAVSPTDTGDGHTYVGQTWDWMTRLAGVSSITEWQRDDAPSVLAYGYPGIPMGAGLNSKGIALCWTSAALAKSGKASPRIGVPSYALIEHLLAQNDIEAVIREAKRDKHAGWFTFVMADGEGNLVNIEGSPDGVVVERSSDQLARVDFATPQMSAKQPGGPAQLHPRCQQMYKLLKQTAGKNDQKMLERYFTEKEYEICGWKNPRNKSIDVMIYDTTGRKAYLTRGPFYGVDWHEYAFSKSPKSERELVAH